MEFLAPGETSLSVRSKEILLFLQAMKGFNKSAYCTLCDCNIILLCAVPDLNSVMKSFIGITV